MKTPLQRRLKRVGHAIFPPALTKYQIAYRNYRRGEPEIRLLDQLVDRNKEAIDIGAYTGAYTFFLQRLVHHVHAFEPQSQCAEFLRRAYKQTVSVYPVALSDRDGRGEMSSPNDTGDPSQGARLNFDQRSRAPGNPHLAVDVRTLDSFGFENVGFIKIDAEGEERRILAGGRSTIERCRPVMLIEIEERHLAGNIREVFEYIESLGYRGSFLNQRAIQPLSAFSVETMQRARLTGDRTKPYINNFSFRPV